MADTPRRVLITGASSGLGRALAQGLAGEGATVLATARREARLLDLAKAYPSIEPHALDVTDRDAVAAFAATVGPLDAAVFNAGITHADSFDAGSLEGDRALVETNVLANLHLARALKPALAGGRLVLVGSMAGFVPLPGQAVYCGTKAFVQNFGLALREEWRGEVSVGVFAPGGIKTEMTDIEAMAHLTKHMAPVEDVAADLARFIGSDRAMRVPGAGNRMQAMLARFTPPATLARLMGRVYKR